MSDADCVQLLGLLLDIVGVGVFSWGELASAGARLAQAAEVPPRKPWYRTGPLWLARRLGSHDPFAGDSFTAEDLPVKFWGLVLIMLGFLLQMLAVLGGP